MMDKKTIDTFVAIDKRIKSVRGGIYNSSVVETVHDPFLGHIFGEIELTIFDLHLIAIISQVHVLITGPTGHAKSALAKLICRCVFGKEHKGTKEEDGGWFLKRLDPHLSEEKFANLKIKSSNEDDDKDKTLRDSVEPAPFLNLPAGILDELNRCPAALTNALLGFCDVDDPEMELMCGLKNEVGHRYNNAKGSEKRYHSLIGTMNEGKQYSGIFDVDPALHRRFSLEIPFEDLRPTPKDVYDLIDNDTFQAEDINYDSLIEEVVTVSDKIAFIPIQPLAKVYLAYLANIGRCPHSPNGFHPEKASQELCSKAECRIQKIADSFCPSVSGFNLALIKILKQTTRGLAALRVVRTIEAVRKACDTEDKEQIEKLREFTNTESEGVELFNQVSEKYLKNIMVTANDIKAMVPFVGLGKIWMAEEYVAKNFAGSSLHAMKHYAQIAYSWLENFFRQHHSLVTELNNGNGAIDTLRQRLEHAEKFNDPFIRPTIEPLLIKYTSQRRNGEEIAEDIESSKQVYDCAEELICK
jgi:hypothetical protein